MVIHTYILHQFHAMTIHAFHSLFLEVQISPLTSVETVTEGGTATVCIGVSLGSLQTVVQVDVRTITSIASTGEKALPKLGFPHARH